MGLCLLRSCDGAVRERRIPHRTGKEKLSFICACILVHISSYLTRPHTSENFRLYTLDLLPPHMLQLCFVLVLVGITMVVSTMYIYVVPYLYTTQHPVMFTLYVIYGHYLLVMICFNYFSGVYTNPGAAPRVFAIL